MDILLLTDVKCGDSSLTAGKVVSAGELDALHPGLCDHLLAHQSAEIYNPKKVDGVDPELALAREANAQLQAELAELRAKLEAAKDAPPVSEGDKRRKKQQMQGEG